MKPVRARVLTFPGGPSLVLPVDVGRVAHLRRELRRVEVPGGALSIQRTRPARRTPRAPVVLVHGFAQNGRSWEVSRRSLANALADAGYDVFNVDLRGVGRSRAAGSPPARAFHEWVDLDLPAVLDGVRSAGHPGPAFLVGHSLGGAAACALAGRMPTRVRGVATLAGIWDFARSSAWLGLASRTLHSLHVPVARAGLDARVPTDVAGRLLHRFRGAMDLPVARWLPLQAWAPGSLEPEILEEAVRTSFEPVSLGLAASLAALGSGRPLADETGRPYAPDFEALTHLPLLVLAGGADRLVSTRDSRAAFERSLSRDKAFRRFGAAAGTPAFGHMDVILGRHAPRFVWPMVVDWLDRH